MPLFLDRHDLTGKAFEFMTPDQMLAVHQCDLREQERFGVSYLTYWWHEGAKTAFCLVEAPSSKVAEQVHLEAHGIAGIPAEVIQVDWESIESFLGPVKIAPADRILEDTAFRCVLSSEVTPLGSPVPGSPNLLRQIDERGGRPVPGAGGGPVGSFASTVAALECALAMQRAFAPLASIYQGAPVHVRVGISAGEPVMNGAGLFGDVVTEATELRKRARAGEILVSSDVKALCEPKGFTFVQTEIGVYRLDGRTDKLQQTVRNNSAAEGLSLREVEVLQRIAAGRTNQEIADSLFISRNTVATHIRNIFAKIDSSNRAEAASYAIRRGLV